MAQEMLSAFSAKIIEEPRIYAPTRVFTSGSADDALDAALSALRSAGSSSTVSTSQTTGKTRSYPVISLDNEAVKSWDPARLKYLAQAMYGFDQDHFRAKVREFRHQQQLGYRNLKSRYGDSIPATAINELANELDEYACEGYRAYLKLTFRSDKPITGWNRRGTVYLHSMQYPSILSGPPQSEQIAQMLGLFAQDGPDGLASMANHKPPATTSVQHPLILRSNGNLTFKLVSSRGSD